LRIRFALTESHFLWQRTGQLDDMKHGIAPYVQVSEKLAIAQPLGCFLGILAVVFSQQ
jgi:hypothetical protein